MYSCLEGSSYVTSDPEIIFKARDTAVQNVLCSQRNGCTVAYCSADVQKMALYFAGKNTLISTKQNPTSSFTPLALLLLTS